MRITRCLTLWLLMFALMFALAGSAQAQQDDPGKPLLEALASGSYAAKGDAIDAIVASGDSRSRAWLEALNDGKLQRNKKTGQFVLVLANRGRDWPVEDALSGEPLGEMSRRVLDRIGINNALRGKLRSTLAVLDLYVEDPDARLSAANDLLGQVDEAMVAPLEAVRDQEPNEAVQKRLTEALAIYRLEQGDPE
ncbi:MAG: urea ABC transporter permease subunit UrtB, partial [Onishia taeanensis]